MELLFALVAHLGVTYSSAWKIANAIDAGMSITAAISIVTGITSIAGMFLIAIRNAAKRVATRYLVLW